MKSRYDKGIENHIFKQSDKVLVFLPVPSHPLQAKYFGPYDIEKKISDLNYVICTPDQRKKKRICHINMLKKYIERNNGATAKPVSTLTNINTTNQFEHCLDNNKDICSKEKDIVYGLHLKISEILSNLNVKYLPDNEIKEIFSLVNDFRNLFPDVPSKKTTTQHDVLVGDEKPIKHHPYHVNPIKVQHLRKEINFILDNDIIEPSNSE